MQVSRFRTLITLCAILAFSSCLMFGADEAAVLRSSGAVSVNGSGAPDTTALFSGDQVQTANGGIVTISSPGSSVFVPSNSQVVFKGNVVNVASGSAKISTTKGMAAQSESSVISPSTSKANYEVNRVGNNLSVHASSGALTVKTAGRTFAVAEGRTETINAATGKVVATSRASGMQGGSLMPSETLFSPTTAQKPGGELNYCNNAYYCHKRSGVSGISPCKCLFIQ